MGIYDYPLVNVYIAIENGHRNSLFTHLKWRFSIVMQFMENMMIKHMMGLMGHPPNISDKATEKIHIFHRVEH